MSTAILSRRLVSATAFVLLASHARAANIELPVSTTLQPGHRVDVAGFDVLGATQVGLRAIRPEYLASHQVLPPTWANLGPGGTASFWIPTPLNFTDGPQYRRDAVQVYFQSPTPGLWAFPGRDYLGFDPSPGGSNLTITGFDVAPPYYLNFSHVRVDYTVDGAPFVDTIDALMMVPEPTTLSLVLMPLAILVRRRPAKP